MPLEISKPTLAENAFKEGFNCAQAVLAAYAEELSLPRPTAFKIAAGFGGGMGRKQEVCGAVSGAIMVIGLIYGATSAEDKVNKEKTYIAVRQFIDAFEKIHGTIHCRELLPGCCLLTEEGQKLFKEQRLMEKCSEFVKTACKIVDELKMNFIK